MKYVGQVRAVVMLLFVLVSCLFSSSVCLGASNEPECMKPLQELLNASLTETPSVGISVAVFDAKENRILTATAGYSHDDVSIVPEMRWGIGSNTKTFAAVLCLKLEEAGLLGIDDLVSGYLPDMDNIPTGLTLRHCLQHHSGLSDVYDNEHFDHSFDEDPLRVWRPIEVLRFLPEPHSTPGQVAHYSASNYIVIAAVVESITGLGYQEVVRKYISEPLGLEDTFVDGYELVSGMAHPWSGGVDVSDRNRTALNTSCSAAGCMASTATDMVRWYHALFKEQFLTEISYKQFTDMKPWTFDRFYQEVGLGIFKVKHNDRDYYAHGGGIDGYFSFTLHDIKSGNSIIAMTTGDFLAAEELSYNIAELMSCCL